MKTRQRIVLSAVLHLIILGASLSCCLLGIGGVLAALIAYGAIISLVCAWRDWAEDLPDDLRQARSTR